MARTAPERIHIRARTSFNEIVQGQEATVEMNAKVQGWLNAGLVEVVHDGTTEAGPGSAEPDDNDRVAPGAQGGRKTGRQPRQGFGTGGYGSAAG